MMKNTEIAKILREMGGYYEMKNVPFKPRAYERAADSIEALDEPIEEIHKEKGFKGLTTIPGVGQGIAEHIEELIKTGRLKKYQHLKKQIPVNLPQLTSIAGVGAKTVGELYKKLGVRIAADLKRAVAGHQLEKLKGFGEKSEENIRRALETQSGFEKRYLLGQIYPIVEKLRKSLADSKLFAKVMVAGSYRRRQETVGDIDILAVAPDSKRAMDYFTKIPDAARVVERGTTKAVIKLESGIQVDLRIVPKESWGAAAQYFTGDLAHNIKMRRMAIEKGLKLSEYGLFKIKKSKIKNQNDKLKFKNEEDVYKTLGMDYIEPELRTDSGEIEAALRHKLPKLINYGDIRGDLQVQTNWTDGTNSIEEMARAALELGREYIAITDHTKTLYMTGGLDEKKLMQQMKEIDRLNKKFKRSPLPNPPPQGEGTKNKFLPLAGVPQKSTRFWGRLEGGGKVGVKFRILKGAEVNILKDGSLDIEDSVLEKLDIVGISIHSHFKLSRADQTKRIIRAMSNPHVDILFHPTTRIIQKRLPIDFDFPAVLVAAKKYRVALEIDAHPSRLDLHDKMIRQSVEAGVKLVIDSDAHHARELDYLHFGEAQARRGWATKNDVLNTKSVEELLKYFKK